MADWDPELTVDLPLARRLVAAQAPELATAPIELVGVGWDNTVYAVDGRWAFRFPRRAVAVAGIEREIAVLPRLASRVPAPIPRPRWIGRPTRDFPWPFFGAALIDGSEATVAFDDAARERLAPRLGAFLRTLHGLRLPVELPYDPTARADTARRVPMAERRLAELAASGIDAPLGALREVVDEARGLPPTRRRALLHGDLHVRHVLVGPEPARPLAGVIDWGDVCVGDPAIDLGIAWSLLPPPARRAFFDAYGPIEADQAVRGRLLAVFLNATLALYAAAEGLGDLRDEAVAGLRRAVA